MGVAISSCTKLLNGDPDLDYMHADGQPCHYPAAGGHEESSQGPLLALRIAYAPIEESTGVKASPFAAGDEVAVIRFEKVKGWEPLRWRQERTAKQRAAMDSSHRRFWPEGPRFSTAQRFWGAKVISSDGRGGFEEHLCLLQVAVAPKDRALENIRQDVEDARDVASYAHRFNLQTARTCGDVDPESVPGVKVCAPVACTVLGSAAPDLARPGEAVLLTWYPWPVVRKFVFEGGEDFLELPQAFFHYTYWFTAGREQLADLQGVEDGDDVILVDPVVLRTPPPTIGNLLTTLVTGTAAQGALGSDFQAQGGPHGAAGQGGPADWRFEACHPQCGQLCKAFDPHRRSATCGRKHCGLNLPSCGVGGA
jgi:hypothetical protein